MASKIPEWRVVTVRGLPPIYQIEDEYGEVPANSLFDSYHAALIEAARLTKEALDNYDGPEVA